jgi:periplasmic protein TonB
VPEATVVRLVGRVGIDGLFSDLHSVSADVQPAYAASALEASRQWVFTPTLLNGAPIEVNMSITVSYSWN